MKNSIQRLLPFFICLFYYASLNTKSLTYNIVLLLQLALPVVSAQVQGSIRSASSADGSPQPSVAAQSPTPHKPLRESEDGRSTDGEELPK